MKRKVLKMEEHITVRDENAKLMWGRCRSVTFRDKTKYNRKIKYKGRGEE